MKASWGDGIIVNRMNSIKALGVRVPAVRDAFDAWYDYLKSVDKQREITANDALELYCFILIMHPVNKMFFPSMHKNEIHIQANKLSEVILENG